MVFVLVGCAQRSVTPITSGFRCLVRIEYDTLSFVGELDRTDESKMILCMTEPSEISGLTMTCETDSLSIEYMGISLELTDEQLPVGMAVKAMADVLDACMDEKVDGEFLKGETAYGVYMLSLDHDSGYPVCLELPSAELKVTFSDWEVPTL